MSIKGILLLASMALAIAAFVSASPASALEYRLYDAKQKETITKDTEMTFSGPMKFSYLLGNGFECTVHMTITTDNGGSAVSEGGVIVSGTRITKFNITSAICIVFGNLNKGCKIKAMHYPGLPWGVSIGSKSLGFGISFEMTFEKCDIPGLTFTKFNYPASSLAVTMDNASEISSLSISGVGSAQHNFQSYGSEVGGLLSLSEADKKTYGVELVE